MGLLDVVFGEKRKDIYAYGLPVEDLARATLPDSRLETVQAKFTRAPVGPVEYSFDYRRDPGVVPPSGHGGPYLLLTSQHYLYPLFAHAFKPFYIEDFGEVEKIIAASTSGNFGEKRKEFDIEFGDERDISFYRYILLPHQLKKEDFVRLFKDPKLKARNVNISFISFDATESDYQFQIHQESRFRT